MTQKNAVLSYLAVETYKYGCLLLSNRATLDFTGVVMNGVCLQTTICLSFERGKASNFTGIFSLSLSPSLSLSLSLPLSNNVSHMFIFSALIITFRQTA